MDQEYVTLLSTQLMTDEEELAEVNDEPMFDERI